MDRDSDTGRQRTGTQTDRDRCTHGQRQILRRIGRGTGHRPTETGTLTGRDRETDGQGHGNR
jgi:hypothetical protein